MGLLGPAATGWATGPWPISVGPGGLEDPWLACGPAVPVAVATGLCLLGELPPACATCVRTEYGTSHGASGSSLTRRRDRDALTVLFEVGLACCVACAVLLLGLFPLLGLPWDLGDERRLPSSDLVELCFATSWLREWDLFEFASFDEGAAGLAGTSTC